MENAQCFRVTMMCRLLSVQKLVACVTTDGILTLDVRRGSAPLVVSGVTCEDDELSFGNYAPERYAWVYESPRRLEVPVPVKGMYGLYKLPDTMLAAVWDQVVTIDDARGVET